jgi:hypothetical protein
MLSPLWSNITTFRVALAPLSSSSSSSPSSSSQSSLMRTVPAAAAEAAAAALATTAAGYRLPEAHRVLLSLESSLINAILVHHHDFCSKPFGVVAVKPIGVGSPLIFAGEPSTQTVYAHRCLCDQPGKPTYTIPQCKVKFPASVVMDAYLSSIRVTRPPSLAAPGTGPLPKPKHTYSFNKERVNALMIQPGPSCRPGGTQLKSIRTLGSGEKMVIFGDGVAEVPVAFWCTCGDSMHCRYDVDAAIVQFQQVDASAASVNFSASLIAHTWSCAFRGCSKFRSTDRPLQRCSACRNTYYCSKDSFWTGTNTSGCADRKRAILARVCHYVQALKELTSLPLCRRPSYSLYGALLSSSSPALQLEHCQPVRGRSMPVHPQHLR